MNLSSRFIAINDSKVLTHFLTLVSQLFDFINTEKSHTFITYLVRTVPILNFSTKSITVILSEKYLQIFHFNSKINILSVNKGSRAIRLVTSKKLSSYTSSGLILYSLRTSIVMIRYEDLTSCFSATLLNLSFTVGIKGSL